MWGLLVVCLWLTIAAFGGNSKAFLENSSPMSRFWQQVPQSKVPAHWLVTMGVDIVVKTFHNKVVYSTLCNK
jgi:hypothetical protein